MFTNKHVVVALIIAPILSVLAWYAVGAFIGEEPQLAQAGNAYPLLAASNCRWPSGHCELENEDFSVSLTMEDDRLLLTSHQPLDGVMLAIAAVAQEQQPNRMSQLDESAQRWALSLESIPTPGQRIHLVASTSGRQFFGDASTVFVSEDESGLPEPAQ
mgnify:FL=1